MHYHSGIAVFELSHAQEFNCTKIIFPTCVCSSSVMMQEEALLSLSSPALLVDLDKVQRNAHRMMERCDKLGVKLRPHMKTHKTLYD